MKRQRTLAVTLLLGGLLIARGASADSPGLQIGITSYDAQHNYAIGRQVAKNPGANTVHFCWMMSDQVPVSMENVYRFVHYNSYDIAAAQLNQGMNGTSVSLNQWARAGFCRIDTDGDNLAHLVFHQRDSLIQPFHVWHLFFPMEGSGLHLGDELAMPGLYPDETDMYWADIAVEQNHGTKDGSTDIYHIIAMGACDGCDIPGNRLWYWRYNAGAPMPLWEGPSLIDSTSSLGYTLDADDNSNHVCLVYTSDFSTDGLNGLNNVAYRESQTSGAGWIDGTELGPINKNFASYYHDPIGPSAWIETSVLYDQAGDLHILFAEQRESGSEQIAIRHWRKSRSPTPGGWPVSEPVVYAWYDNPGTWGRTLNIGFISIGVGDGSTLCDGEDNTDYLYAVYGKLCGESPEEQADTSALGFCNAELYLSVSRDHGDFWSAPINLTNTKTPDCSPVDPENPGPGDCASEAWASLARDVDDLHILYIADRKAGSFLESGWTINPVNYLRLPGGTTDDPYLCATPPPQYHATLDTSAGPCVSFDIASGDVDSTLLRLFNSGPGPMTAVVTARYVYPPDSPEWLLVDGLDTAEFTVPSNSSMAAVVDFDAASLPPGVYEGQILVTHNDHLQMSPDTLDLVLSIDWCPCHTDPQCDGVPDVLDVVRAVNCMFSFHCDLFIYNCTYSDTDVDCSGFTNILDAVRLVNVVFRSGDPDAQFCHPCP